MGKSLAALVSVLAIACSSAYESAPTPDGGATSSSSSGSASGGDAGPACRADLAADPNNCGTCGHACPVRANGVPACNAGVCGVACNLKVGNCDGDDANGCETALDDNPRHCGACGHDCEGGACVGGVCQPFILAGGEGTCNAIALSSTDVFWAALGKGIDACPRSGCGEAGASFLPGMDGVFALGGTVYAASTSTGTAVSCPVSGCSGNPTPIARGLGNARTVTADQSAVYLGYGTSIGSCPLSGCTGSPTPLADGINNPSSLVVSEGYLYWSEAFGPGGIWRRSLLRPDASAAERLIGGLNVPSAIVVDAQKIYFMQSDSGGAIGVIPIGGAINATTFASVGAFVRGIAGDANSIFVALDDSIIQIDKATATKKTVASGSFFSRGIAVDDKAVYITTRNGVTKVVR